MPGKGVQPVYRCPKGGLHKWKKKVTITPMLRIRIVLVKCKKCGRYPQGSISTRS